MFVRGWFDGLTGSEQNFVIAVVLVVVGLLFGGLTAWVIRRVLEAFDVDEAVEGTAFERTARGLGTSTVGLLSQLCGFFVFLVAALYAFEILRFLPSRRLLEAISLLLPRVFVAALVLIVGVLLSDKAEIVVGERLRSVKLPEVTVLPQLVKFSILYVAVLVALSQLGVATAALLILLAAYSFGLFFLGGLAFKDLLSSAAAGIYLLLTEPYSIGDEVEIDGSRGIVQEVDVLVTRIENEGEEYVIPNCKVMEQGAMRVRG
jgi:small-conductance mechanosensitive channel